MFRGVLGADGRRLDRHRAARIVRRVARRAGITKAVGPCTLRHAFITAAPDAGVPLRDVREAASHADPRTTMRYDRARVSQDRHATCIVAAYVAGAAPLTTLLPEAARAGMLSPGGCPLAGSSNGRGAGSSVASSAQMTSDTTAMRESGRLMAGATSGA